MDVLVNINSLQPPITGIGRYTSELLRCLVKDHNIQAFDLTKNYSTSKLQEKLKYLDEFSNNPSHQNKLQTSLKKIVRQLPYAYKLRQFIQHQINDSQFKLCKDYVYWEPNYILQPFEGVSVATIHDLSYVQYPEHHTKESLKWLEGNVEESIDRASAIVTLSNFSKGELIKYFPISESKISIVPPAVSDDFRRYVTDDEIGLIKAKYNLPANYILSVGTLEPRKNLKSLVKAYSLLPKKLKQHYPLVMVGAKGWGDIGEDFQFMLDRKEIIALGYIAQNDIPIIYKAADLFVYISLYEGFGMPVAEAMASGTMVITSENSAMSEVAQGSAELVNPLDIEQISTKMAYFIQNKEARKHLIDKSEAIITDWSWQKSADKLTTLFQNIK